MVLLIVVDFSTQDTDGEATISFSEYITGITRATPLTDKGFRFSQGMVTTTKEENRKLLEEITGPSMHALAKDELIAPGLWARLDQTKRAALEALPPPRKLSLGWLSTKRLLEKELSK